MLLYISANGLAFHEAQEARLFAGSWATHGCRVSAKPAFPTQSLLAGFPLSTTTILPRVCASGPAGTQGPLSSRQKHERRAPSTTRPCLFPGYANAQLSMMNGSLLCYLHAALFPSRFLQFKRVVDGWMKPTIETLVPGTTLDALRDGSNSS